MRKAFLIAPASMIVGHTHDQDVEDQTDERARRQIVENLIPSLCICDCRAETNLCAYSIARKGVLVRQKQRRRTDKRNHNKRDIQWLLYNPYQADLPALLARVLTTHRIAANGVILKRISAARPSSEHSSASREKAQAVRTSSGWVCENHPTGVTIGSEEQLEC